MMEMIATTMGRKEIEADWTCWGFQWHSFNGNNDRALIERIKLMNERLMDGNGGKMYQFEVDALANSLIFI